MAEFENFRKRSEKEKSQMYEVGAKSILEKILPVVDNFERGLKRMPERCEGSICTKVWKRSTSSLNDFLGGSRRESDRGARQCNLIRISTTQ